jgi:predicted lysophospholipase L1 biosynthesis ABC-type transport system permease subunit
MDAEHSELGKHAKVAPTFAAIALLLAAIGLYAVIAHSVSQRTKEIGVRIALGAASHDIRRLILREGMRPVALGLILGLTVSLAVNRILQSQLVGVSPYDPVTLTTTPAVLVLVALLACQLPSQRALRIEPAAWPRRSSHCGSAVNCPAASGERKRFLTRAARLSSDPRAKRDWRAGSRPRRRLPPR